MGTLVYVLKHLPGQHAQKLHDPYKGVRGKSSLDIVDTHGLSEGPIAQAMLSSLEAIDSVHAFPEGMHDKLPLKVEESDAYEAGYRVTNNKGALSPKELFINPDNAQPHLDTAHEMGHYFDHRGANVAKPIVFASDETVLDSSSPMYSIMKSISDSPSFRGIKKEVGRQFSLNETNRWGMEVTSTYQLAQQRADYLRSPREAFARAYSQYITTKSGHPEMLKELRKVQRRDARPKAQRLDYKTYWSDKEFEPIAQAFDAYFASMGLAK